MIGILKFKLPEEREEFEIACKSSAFQGAIQELDNKLRAKLKYCDLLERDYEIYDEIRSWLHSCLEENNCTLW